MVATVGDWIVANINYFGAIGIISGALGIILLNFDKDMDKRWENIGGWRGWFSKKFPNRSKVRTKKVSMILIVTAFISIGIIISTLFFTPERWNIYD